MNDPRPLFAAASLLLVGGAALLWTRTARAAVADTAAGTVADPGADLSAPAEFSFSTVTDQVMQGLNEIVQPSTPPNAQEQANQDAFLLTIRKAEGTAGPDGYRTLFGGGLFDSFADHPRLKVTANLQGRAITSTAAGAYQALSSTWDDFIRSQGAHDFSPSSQDAFAVWCIRRRGALADVRAGRFDIAAEKVRKEWASFPGAGYSQPEKSLASLRLAFSDAGGVIA